MVLRRKKKKKKLVKKPNHHIEEEYDEYEDEDQDQEEEEYEYVEDYEEDPPPIKKKRNRAPAEHEESLCVGCGHKNICSKRAQILDMHTQIKESMSIAQRPGYAQFGFRSVIDTCEDFVPTINQGKDHNGDVRYSFSMESDTVTIQGKRKKKKT